jgi:hypothetical protein
MPWLDALRITVVGDDQTGIMPEEIQAVVAKCANHRVTLVELALDFDNASGVDGLFVSRYGRFGKSRRRENRGGLGQQRFGSRGSLKLVRCYQKRALACFRVELELHAALLRKFGVTDCRDIYVVASKLIPSHLEFVGFRWKKLERSLTRRLGAKGGDILKEARRQRDEVSVRDALRFLSKSGVPNPHRFLKSLEINSEVKVALRRWAELFYKELAI